MSCPTCDHTMEGCGHGLFHCPRCGTVKRDDAVYTPAIVGRLREFTSTLGPAWTALAHLLGIFESIYPPDRRPVV